MYTMNEIEEKIKLAKEIVLSGAELLGVTAAIHGGCNGIG